MMLRCARRWKRLKPGRLYKRCLMDWMPLSAMGAVACLAAKSSVLASLVRLRVMHVLLLQMNQFRRWMYLFKQLSLIC